MRQYSAKLIYLHSLCGLKSKCPNVQYVGVFPGNVVDNLNRTVYMSICHAHGNYHSSHTSLALQFLEF